MKKHTLVFTNSLTNDFVGVEKSFTDVKVHIGLEEVYRLFGKGKNFGKGPLSQFLLDAVEDSDGERKIDFINIRDYHDENDPLQRGELLRHGNHNIIGTAGAEFLDILAPIVDKGYTINISGLSISHRVLDEILRKVLGKNPLDLTAEEKANINIIIVGVYTEITVHNTAVKLRNDYEFPNVYVCPYLVGSKNNNSHRVSLQVDFPNGLINVVPSFKEIAKLAGIDEKKSDSYFSGSCKILPKEANDALSEDYKNIIQNIFLFYSQLELIPIAGGYSGSLLFLANGKKDNVKMAPVILKADHYSNMKKEITGYNMVKDLLGQNVPGFDVPVSFGNYIGVKMEFASMAGTPSTLQSILEKAKSDRELNNFLGKLTNILQILKNKLYQNTLIETKLDVLEEFGLNWKQQALWLKENIGFILSPDYLKDSSLQVAEGLIIKNFIHDFEQLQDKSIQLDVDQSVCHGDLNLANIITDENNNLWVIDWTHASERPLEFDFAKIENDIKFVIPKIFSESELFNLYAFEKLIQAKLDLDPLEKLPSAYSFISYDFRYKMLYNSIKALREIYLSLKKDKNQLLYSLALLKYSTHTLSFDERRGRGECKLSQLKFALLSTSVLMEYIMAQSNVR